MKSKAAAEKKSVMTKEILLGLLKAGAVLTVAIAAPGALRIFKDCWKDEQWEGYYPSYIERTARRLYRRGFVKLREKDGRTQVIITDKGKTELLQFNLTKLHLIKPEKWDGKWRIVIFDIPNHYKKIRDILRERLKMMEFFQFQESVFVTPYPCEQEIKFLREMLHVPHNIKLITADTIENDKDLRIIFKL